MRQSAGPIARLGSDRRLRAALTSASLSISSISTSREER
jgi:hypothetical protein